MKLPFWLERITDGGGLAVALIVDLIINFICFSLLAPDTWTSIAFIATGTMIVLFVFRSRAKGDHFAWIIFVVIVFFFDLSFALEATKTQSDITTARNDAEITRLDSRMAESSALLADLQAQYSSAMQRETMDQLDSQIRLTQSRLDKYESDRAIRLALISSGRVIRTPMTADAIFNAIPQSIIDHRFIQLFIFAMIFMGLQLIIATSIEVKQVETVAPAPVVTPPPELPTEVSEDDIKTFVKYSWYKIRSKSDGAILSEDVFLRLMKSRNETYDEKVYRYLRKKCIELSIIDEKGLANMEDEGIIVGSLSKEVG